MVMGYSFGCINPAAALAVRKKKNLREIGTKNLGATNAAVAFGKKYGVLVMVIDILKSFISVKLARILFPQLYIAGLVAGGSAVMGHIFPVQMKFKGGKGLAAFGGLILAFDPMMFLMLKKKADGNAKKEYIFASLCAALYGVLNIVLKMLLIPQVNMAIK